MSNRRQTFGRRRDDAGRRTGPDASRPRSDHPHPAPHSHAGHPGPVSSHKHSHDAGDNAPPHEHLGSGHPTGVWATIRAILHIDAHAHDPIESDLISTSLGLRALAISFGALIATAVFQAVIVAFSGSAGLLADTIHNFGDASTAIPLAIAFWLLRRGRSDRFTYGWGRAEDLAGLFIVLAILGSAAVAGYEAVNKLIDGRVPTHVPWALAGGVIGFAGNEAVAQFRIVVGKRIGSAALIADGYHARIDGVTSLAAVVGLLGVVAGFPIADPIAGLAITAMIVWIVVRHAAPPVFRRMLDGVDDATPPLVKHSALHVAGVQEVADVRARWSGHRLLIDLTVAIRPQATVVETAAIADRIRQEVRRHLPHTGDVHVEMTPATSG